MTSPAKAKVDAIGLEAICERVADGESLTGIAVDIGVSIGTLLSWIEMDSERSARVRESRIISARIWDEKAESGIERAGDPFDLAKAKELAHHYRWRAAKIAPRDYGERVTQEVTGADGGPVEISVKVPLDFEAIKARSETL